MYIASNGAGRQLNAPVDICQSLLGDSLTLFMFLDVGGNIHVSCYVSVVTPFLFKDGMLIVFKFRWTASMALRSSNH